VTGGQGFLGSHVAARLASLGAATHGLARRETPAGTGITWFRGDLTDRASVGRIVRELRPDVVFHLAGQTSAAPDRDLVLPSLLDNLTGTVILLHELAEVGCRRVVATASLEEPEAAVHEVVPRSPYGASKWAEAGYARMFNALFDLPVVLVRPYMTYGPRQRASKLIPSLTLSLLRGQSPTISQPDREVDWVFVDDVVEGVLAAGLAPDVEGRTIDLGSGALLPIRELADTLCKVVGKSAVPVLARPSGPVGVHGRRAETQTARTRLGWSATTSLEKGLEQTVAWYQARLNATPEANLQRQRCTPTERN